MLFGLLKFRKKGVRNVFGREFTEEDRERSTVAKLESDIRRARIKALQEKLHNMKAEMEQRNLEESVGRLENDLYGGDEDEEEDEDQQGMAGFPTSPDAMFMQIIMQALHAGKNGADAPTLPVQAVKQPLNLSDDELRKIKEEIPPQFLKKARKMSDADLIETARLYKPELFDAYDDDTLKRALKIVRE